MGWTIVQGYSFKQVSSTCNRQKNSPWEINWKRSNKSGSGLDPSSTYEFPPRIALWDLQLERPKKLALGMGISKSEAKKAAEDATAE